MGAAAGRTDGDVAAFYAASYPRLVGVLAVAAGSRAEAEEVVQEAFVRLLPRWARVSRYDDPEAWVRQVAFRLLSNRFRRARRRLLPVGDVPGPTPSGDRVAVTRALAGLPLTQRQVVVLHHLCDLPVAEVAAVLAVPVGTVKSRLSRARTTLVAAFPQEVLDRD